MRRSILVPLLITISLLLSVVPSLHAGDCYYRGHGRYYGGYGGYSGSDVAVAGAIGLVSGLLIGSANRRAYYAPRPVYAAPVYRAPVYRSAPVYYRRPVVTQRTYRAVRYAPSHQRVYVGKICR